MTTWQSSVAHDLAFTLVLWLQADNLGDVGNLYEDIRLVQPTMLSATPVFWNKLYTEYHEVIAFVTPPAT